MTGGEVELGPLLATKLYVPGAHGALVDRPRLTERLDRGAESALLLVSAPAGFGKSTLLAQWASSRDVAWLSLDRDDNDPTRFWTYVVAALRTAVPGVGETAGSMLAQGAPTQAVLAVLLNDLVATPHDVLLVLDDYHLVETPAVHEAVAFLLDHLPERLHLVISGRTDPPLPMARLRAAGRLVEVRASDLRFTSDEVDAYLNRSMGLRLTAPDTAALEARTEGWIAALQLAALSLQGRDDAGGFIAGFAGDDRYVVNYLVEEVLVRQPEQVQSFLLHTSILDRLTGPLCDAVTGQPTGRSMLEALDRANLFLVPLDDRRQWYRYHRLFADVLGARLLEAHPDRLPELHRRASAWYAHEGAVAEAVGHALAAGDVDRAADLVELAVPTMRRQRQEATVLGWLRALPEPVLRMRPVLSVHYAGALLSTGHLDDVDERLRDAERWLDPGADRSVMTVLDHVEFARMPALLALYRAAHWLALGDVTSAIASAESALENAGDADLVRGAAAGLLGLAYWATGELEAGHRSWAESATSLERAGHLADTFGCAVAMADIRLAQGRLRDAQRTYERALALAGPALRGAADMFVGLAGVHRERGDLAAAEDDLARSDALGDHLGLPQNPYRWRVAMARIRESAGDLDGALTLLDDAERVYVPDFFPDVHPIAAVRARVQIRQGDLAGARSWAVARGLSADDDLVYLREFEHLTLARLLAASPEDRDQAVRLLERLLAAAESGGRTGSALEILVQLALAQQARGDGRAATEAVERAVALAAPEGYVRTFADEGRPLAALLAKGTPAARRLLAAFGERPVRQPLVDPLSERELDVLRLLRSDLDGPEIARELVVSLHTVRSHTKSIYAKLGVNSRRAAVRRAEELDLLGTTGT